MITQSAHPDANIIWGTAFDEHLSDEMNVTVVATGFESTPSVDEPIQAHIDSRNAAAGRTASTTTASAAPSTAAPAAPAQPAASKPVTPVMPDPTPAPAPVEKSDPVIPNPVFNDVFGTGIDTAPNKAASDDEEDDGDYFNDLLSILNKRP